MEREAAYLGINTGKDNVALLAAHTDIDTQEQQQQQQQQRDQEHQQQQQRPTASGAAAAAEQHKPQPRYINAVYSSILYWL